MNSYALLNDAELALMLIALAGYPDDDLCRQGAVIEAELLSRYCGEYPPWFTSVQIAVCHSLQQGMRTDAPMPMPYLPICARAMDSIGDRTPAFFNDHLPVIEIARRLAHSGMSLHWNTQLRALEIVEVPFPRSNPVYP